jgi:hypothetical protein
VTKTYPAFGNSDPIKFWRTIKTDRKVIGEYRSANSLS